MNKINLETNLGGKSSKERFPFPYLTSGPGDKGSLGCISLSKVQNNSACYKTYVFLTKVLQATSLYVARSIFGKSIKSTHSVEANRIV